MKVIRVRSGGEMTKWPWRQLELRLFRRCVTITLSRQYALSKPGGR